MGINRLWKLLDAASQPFTLQELAIIEGFQRREGTFMVGVDTDTLMAQCIAGAQSTGVHGPGPLRVLFFKICKFLQSPISLVFVFDGSSRPTTKCGRNVCSLPPSWRGPTQLLVKAFGFVVHEAPGEAEAELAKLNELGIIDAVITTDSDSFVFGAKCVIRSMTLSERQGLKLHSEEMPVYMADAIEHSEAISLTAGGYLLLALALGGDYSKGIDSCGPSTAHALAKCGFGDTLLDAAQSLSNEDFEIFRQNWLTELKCELKTNSKGYLPGRRPALVSKISDIFPDKAVVDLYVHPLTSFSPSHKPPDSQNWKLEMPPQVSNIAAFCRSHLGWGDASDLLKSFGNNLWEGIFLQLLYARDVRYNQEECVIEAAFLRVRVQKSLEKVHQPQRMLRLEPWNRVIFSTKPLSAEVRKAFKDVLDNGIFLKEDSCTIWAPTCILPQAMIRIKTVPNGAYKLERPAEQNTETSTDPPDKQKRRRRTSSPPQAEFIDVTSPLPPLIPSKKRRNSYLSLEPEEIIDVTTPPLESKEKERKHGRHLHSGIVDLTTRVVPVKPSTVKRLRMTRPQGTGSRLLDALDLLDARISSEERHQGKENTHLMQAGPSRSRNIEGSTSLQPLTRSCSDGSYLRAGMRIDNPIIISDSE